MIGELMKSRKIMIMLASIVALLSIGGCTVKQKEDTKQDKTNLSSSIKEDKKAIKQKQLAHLKEHEQEIVDFVKSKSSKVESVQIYWDETQWIDGGLTTPKYYINVFGGINHIDDSGWGIDIPINNDQSIEMREMFMLHEPTIGGKPIS